MTVELGIAVFVCSILFLIYLFLISPRVKNAADTEILLRDYAHRGLWNEKIPENSLSAFEAAARRGYAIELDVRPTKDGVIVVFHDDDLKRMCGRDSRVCDLTYRELSALRLGDSGEVIPTLSQVLRLIRGRVPLLIEVKGELPNPKFCLSLADMLDAYNGAFSIESFSPIILNWFKKHRPAYARGQLVGTIITNEGFAKLAVCILLSNMAMNFLSRPDFIAIHERKRRSIGLWLCVRAFHARSIIWTVRTPEAYISCKKKGYFTIFEGFFPKVNRNVTNKN